jgi:hypothetical protein
MKEIVLYGEAYVVLVDGPKATLVLPRQQYIEGLRLANKWKRRRRQADREAQAAPIAEDKRFRMVQDRLL